MSSKPQNPNSKTKERKIEAMRKLKAAYVSAKEAGTVKSYSISAPK